jgi:thioredoxin 1
MKDVTVDQLEKLKANGNKILLELYADWCTPCKSLIPRIETIEKNFPIVKFVKMNVDKNLDFCKNNNIIAVPTIITYNGSTLVNRATGLKSDEFYINLLNKI